MSRVELLHLSTFCWRSGGDGPGGEEDHDEGQDGGGDEASEHPVGGGFGEFQGFVDVGGEGN